MFAEAEDDSDRDLKIVECLAVSYDATGDSGDIAERSLVMADLVTHVEAKGEPLLEEVLQATAEVASENRLAAVGARLHQVGVYLSRFVFIVQCNFAPGPADACCHVWYPFPSDSEEVVDIVGGERKWIGNAELSRIMTVEIVTHAPAHGRACIDL